MRSKFCSAQKFGEWNTMVSIDTLRKTALSFEQVIELPHFEKTSFRVRKKIFCTLDSTKNCISVKLSAIDQSIYCKVEPAYISAATGAWGKQGWTIFDLGRNKKNIVLEALEKGYQHVASWPPNKTKE